MADISGAYVEELVYKADKLAGLQTSLLERLAKYGYNRLEDYFSERSAYRLTVMARPRITTLADPTTAEITELFAVNSLAGRPLFLIPELTGRAAYVNSKREIIAERAEELGVRLIYTQLSGGTMIESPGDIHFSLMLPLGFPETYSLDAFNGIFLPALRKYVPAVVLSGNDFMVDGVKVGGSTYTMVDGTQIYGINITGEDVTALAAEIIPPRSVKPIGYVDTSTFKEALMADVKAVFGAVI